MGGEALNTVELDSSEVSGNVEVALSPPDFPKHCQTLGATYTISSPNKDVIFKRGEAKATRKIEVKIANGGSPVDVLLIGTPGDIYPVLIGVTYWVKPL